MNKKRGITLAILVITIVILLILSSVVFLDFSSESNSLSKAGEAKIKSDIVTFKDELNSHLSKDPRVDFTLVSIDGENVSENERLKKLIEYIPSLEDAKINNELLYSSILTIENGSLKLYNSSILNQKGIKISDKIVEVILSDIEMYYK